MSAPQGDIYERQDELLRADTGEQVGERVRAGHEYRPVIAVRRPPTDLVGQKTVPAPRSRGPQCQAMTKAGKPCTANATQRSGYARCPFHEEGTDESTKALWRAKGHAAIAGAMTVPDAPDPALATPEAITRFVEETSGRLLRGEISASTAAALTGLAGAALRAYEANLGQKLADLEAIVIERTLRARAVNVIEGEVERG